MQRTFLIAGSFARNDDELAKKQRLVVKALARSIISQGHKIVGGQQNDFDICFAEAASDAAGGVENARSVLQTFALKGAEQLHSFGLVSNSILESWDFPANKGRLRFPEPILRADVVFLIGGTGGTERTCIQAALNKKLVLPIFATGGFAQEAYENELDAPTAKNYQPEGFDMLDRALNSVAAIDEFSKEIVNYAETALVPPQAIALMAFDEEGGVKDTDAYEAFCRACKKFDPPYEPFLVSRSVKGSRIVKEVLDSINECAFCFVEITEERPNVYYELGFAMGANRKVIIAAKKGTELPFNINDVPVIYFEKHGALEASISEKISGFCEFQGRSIPDELKQT